MATLDHAFVNAHTKWLLPETVSPSPLPLPVAAMPTAIALKDERRPSGGAYIHPARRSPHDDDHLNSQPDRKRIKHDSPPRDLPSSSLPPVPAPPPPPPPPKQSIQLGLSGALAASALTAPSGSVLKYQAPADAALPTLLYRLYAFSSSSTAPPSTLHLHRQSTYHVGRDPAVNDLVIGHASVSKQHAALQYRRVKGGEVVPYLMDLGSVNGTFLNGKRVDSARFVELREKDVLTFGSCGKDYVLLHADSEGGEQLPVKAESGGVEKVAAGDGSSVVKKKRPAWADDDDDD